VTRTDPRKLVTIVAEAVLAESLVVALEQIGVTGYTMSDAEGRGSRGRRTGEIPGENVRIETLTGTDTAERILDMLAERYFPDYAIAAWVADVAVVRGEKYR
jgi:nitrogen regulatory protein P-II 2